MKSLHSFINLLYFLLKIQIWNDWKVLNFAGNPTNDIKVNLSILSVGWNVVELTPQLEIFKCIFKCRIASYGMYSPSQQKLSSDVTL